MYYGELTCKSRDSVRNSFSLACEDKQPMRIAMTSGCGTQIFLEGSWTELIPPIEIVLTLYRNQLTVNMARTFFRSCGVAWIGASSVSTGNSYPFVTVTD